MRSGAVVVTGATGFIGGAAARAIVADGHHVTALHRRTVPPPDEPGLCWSTYEDWIAETDRAEAVVHAAAVRHRHGVPGPEYLRENVALTDRLVRASQGRVGRFVLVSSIAVYGWPDLLPIDENSPVAPVGPYGESKAESERIVRLSGLPFAIVRPSITYGPGDTNGLVDKLLRLVSNRRYLMVGNGENRLQLVYAEDLANALVLAALLPGLDGAEFICTYRDPISIAELSRIAADSVGRSLPRLHVPVPLAKLAAVGLETLWRAAPASLGPEPPVTREKIAMMTTDRSYRIDRMRDRLRWEPRTGYAEGLRKTAAAGRDVTASCRK
jgi:nucleoside-diphosphate-sugar epimerase